jgi:hypothetical protein
VSPADADYERLAADALTEEEDKARRQRWRDGDDALRREFLDFVARGGGPGLAGGETRPDPE